MVSPLTNNPSSLFTLLKPSRSFRPILKLTRNLSSMGRSTFIVAVFLMLFFSLSHGIGRKMIGSFSHGHTQRVSLQEKSSETYELDYIDAGPNFNAHGGIPVSPSHPPATPTRH